jgi:protein-disulfide isomerase
MPFSVPFGMRALSLLLAAGVVTACSKQPVPAASAATPPTVVAGAVCDSVACADRNRIQGPDSAKVWLIIASDFQCPYCRQFHDDTYKQIVDQYVTTGKIQIAFVNHPMSMHPHAQIAAEAAMCAAMQNRFWQMHDSLFARQDKWAAMDDPVPAFDSLAVQVGLQEPAWKSCIQSHKTLPLIDFDNTRTTKSGVRGTPSFIVMDKAAPAQGRLAIEGVAPFSEYKRVLDSTLAKAGSH